MKNRLVDKEFWYNILVRGFHTAAQTMLAAIGSASIFKEVNWQFTLSATGLAFIISLLKSIIISVPEYEKKEEG